MFNYVKSDFYKIRRTKVIYVIFLLTAVVASITLYIMNQIATGGMTADMGVSISLISDTMLTGIFGGIIFGELVSDDFTAKSIHNKIISGKGRSSIIFSKLISFALSFSIVLLVYVIAAVVAVVSGEKFAPLAGIPSAFFDLIAGCSAQTNPQIAKCILLCIVIVLCYIARLSICLPVAFKTRKKIPVLVTGFVTSFVFDIMFSLIKDVAVLSDIIKALPYYRMTQLLINASSSDIWGAVLSSVVFTAIMTGITYLLFRRAEIK